MRNLTGSAWINGTKHHWLIKVSLLGIIAAHSLCSRAGESNAAVATPTVAARSNHWSLQPLHSSAELEAELHNKLKTSSSARRRGAKFPSSFGNPLDVFINARLMTNGLSLSPPADRPTLIRRLTFDLIGLPPTPEEIDAFVADRTPDAYARLVDRLLASPRYGERWGRHWLDVARYTESQGFEYDKLRDNAWHYRDYVIRSFNEDKPYDRFMREQIAGDVLEPVTSEGIIAASLLVCGPWDEAGNAQANATQKAITREEELEDLISTVGQTFLGLTLNCARCHSHKFDPIPTVEYYRVKSVFDGIKHGERPYASPSVTRVHDEQVSDWRRQIAAAQSEASRLEVFGSNAVRASVTGTSSNIPIAEVLAALSESQRAEHAAALEKKKKAELALQKITPLPVSYAGTRIQPPVTRVLQRGDVRSPGDVITPGGLGALVDLEADFGLTADAPESERRRKFADWLVDARNPLPARVMANRVWHLHFGQGLVATANDFGAAGARPTHPELLDWLAARFRESGYSVKALHRLIVTSQTYRQSSDIRQRAAELDADNQLLWRYAPRRLEAEAVRDAILAVSGQLNLEMGGPSFRPFDILKFPANAYVPVDKIGPEFNRRTVYRMNVNSGKEPLLDAFDCPDPSVKTPRRGVTTTPLQALALMNNAFVQRQAGHFAARAWQEASGDGAGAVQRAYRLALGRRPSSEELRRALTAAHERSLTNVCWVLLNSTEFVYAR